MQKRALDRGVLLAACRAAGAPEDPAKAQELFKNPPVKISRAAIITAMANDLFEQSQLYAPRKLNDPEKLRILCVRAQDALKTVPESKETKELNSKIQAALKRANVTPADLDYINAHGTSTGLGDEIELKAVERLLGNATDRVAMSSTKSATGHLLGAAGAVEAIACVMALRDGVVPPTIGYREPDPECDLDVTPNVARPRQVRAALSNAFAFGGTNAVVAFKRA